MGRQGPPKTPTLTLKARGSWRAKLPERAHEPGQFEIPSPDCPADLNGPAREMWDTAIKPLFGHAGLMTVLDLHAARMLCRSWARFVEADDRLDTEGLTISTDKGEFLNPAHAVMVAAADRFNRLAGQFGIMPSNRSRLTAALHKRSIDEGKARFFAKSG